MFSDAGTEVRMTRYGSPHTGPYTVNMPGKLGCALLAAALATLASPAAAEPTRLDLVQDRGVVLEHQHLVGNVRAQARRQGVVRHVPQLYAYHPDRSPAYHLDGHRQGFVNELDVTISRFRGARAMVELDTLLARARTSDGDRLRADGLPRADMYLVFYRRAECPACDRVADDLTAWLEKNPDLNSLWIEVSLDGY